MASSTPSSNSTHSTEDVTITNILSFFKTEPNKKNLELFKKTHLSNDELQQKNFDTMTKYITNKDNIRYVRNFLYSLYQYENKKNHNQELQAPNPRIFFSSYLISFHAKTILNLEEDEDIFELSNMLLYHTNTFLKQINETHFNNLYKCLNDFYKLFDLWKNKDKKRIIHNLAKSYWDIESNIIFKLQNDELNEANKQLWLECSRDEQQTIINKVIELGGEESLEYFNSLVPVMVNEDFILNVDTIVKDAFWNKLEEDLSGENPNYLAIIPILEDTKKLFKSCIPKRMDIHQEIDEFINISHIKQMIEHDALEDDDIIDLINYIVDLLISLDSEMYDEENLEWKNKVVKDITDEKPYDQIFPSFFKLLFMKLEEIKDYYDTLRNCMNQVNDQKINQNEKII
tara:strand:- start:2548 stop:3750 length:1203 start_codon:yes stop_codon:yes gene_type:complete